jgi:hypothetical protein
LQLKKRFVKEERIMAKSKVEVERWKDNSAVSAGQRILP